MTNVKITRSNLIMTKPKDALHYCIKHDCSLKKCISKKYPNIALLSKNAFQKPFKNCSLKKCISKLLQIEN